MVRSNTFWRTSNTEISRCRLSISVSSWLTWRAPSLNEAAAARLRARSGRIASSKTTPIPAIATVASGSTTSAVLMNAMRPKALVATSPKAVAMSPVKRPWLVATAARSPWGRAARPS